MSNQWPAGGRVVAVVGPGDADPDLVALAERVGEELARRGAAIVCGGLGGVMAAACRGAKRAAGRTVGILPGGDRRDGNAWLDVAIPTGMGEARNVLVVRAADAVIAIGGAYGTLSEIAFALKLGRRVIGLGTWELARRGRPDRGVVAALDAVDAVTRALA